MQNHEQSQKRPSRDEQPATGGVSELPPRRALLPASDSSHHVPAEPELITRFSIALMAFTLMGMGVGTALPHRFGVITLGTSVVGFIAFGICEATARRQRREIIEQVRSRAEDRLTRQFSAAGQSSRRQEAFGQLGAAGGLGTRTTTDAGGSLGVRLSTAEACPRMMCDDRR